MSRSDTSSPPLSPAPTPASALSPASFRRQQSRPTAETSAYGLVGHDHGPPILLVPLDEGGSGNYADGGLVEEREVDLGVPGIDEEARRRRHKGKGRVPGGPGAAEQLQDAEEFPPATGDDDERESKRIADVSRLPLDTLSYAHRNADSHGWITEPRPVVTSREAASTKPAQVLDARAPERAHLDRDAVGPLAALVSHLPHPVLSPTTFNLPFGRTTSLSDTRVGRRAAVGSQVEHAAAGARRERQFGAEPDAGRAERGRRRLGGALSGRWHAPGVNVEPTAAGAPCDPLVALYRAPPRPNLADVTHKVAPPVPELTHLVIVNLDDPRRVAKDERGRPHLADVPSKPILGRAREIGRAHV